MMNSTTSIIPLLPSGRAEIMASAGLSVVKDSRNDFGCATNPEIEKCRSH